MCFDAFKSGVVSKRYSMKPLGTNSAVENGLTTPKSAFGKPIAQCELSTKSLKPRGIYHTRENVLSASK